ncbi:Alanine aminotransferase 2 [Acromyrmex echinatior]|uniref:alanine transaminase n=1 Tax=Acromyrmex echinatior TaxID=103372 RepID=F4WHT4_ACREC|nr:Alanine aminotransferase 2 [Acromyrmex echinatior]
MASNAVTVMATSNPRGKVLTEDNVFVNLRKMELAMCGSLFFRAREIEKELQKGFEKPFKELTKMNTGDAHAMGQQPITFLRQGLTPTVSPHLLNDPSFPEDAKDRARMILENCNGSSVGSYSESTGIECIRKHVAQYIQERDGDIPCDYHNIILWNGASIGIKTFLNLFNERLDDKPSGVLIPFPQYPLYSATLTEFGLAQIEYYLDEDNKWSLEVSELERTLREVKNICNPRVLVEMGEPYSKMELASFMSISKGYMGECGIRGGYAEIINMDPEVMKVLLKSISAMLCPTVLGQVVMDVVVNPPRPNEPSYEQFQKEKRETLRSLAERSRLIVDTLNSIPGYKANPVMGAMYAFPRFELPSKAIEAARAKSQEPDVFYAFELLENTGILVIPGSYFGQISGTNHFRTTILPQKKKIKTMLEALKQFHIKFLEKYS